MKKEELAQLLNGCKKNYETTPEIKELARANDLAIVFGYSDDGVVFEGVLDEVYGGWDGRSIQVYKKGERIPVEHDDFDNCYRDAEQVEAVEINVENVGKISTSLTLPHNRIDAIWAPDEVDVSWKITSDIPHSAFEVMEDGDVFCIGMVFNINDLK